MDLYDEFGNYVGPELDEDDNSDPESDFGEEPAEEIEENGNGMDIVNYGGGLDPASEENRIVLHEDKKYYPEASEVFPGVKTVTLDEDAQDLATPLIKPIKPKNFSVLQKEAPEMTYSPEFLAALMHTPTLVRNIAIIGQLHHGKTLFVDTLVQATQTEQWDPSKELRYTDTRRDEQERHLSIKSTALSLVLKSLTGKSFLLNLLDCPGHVNFSDESTAAIRAADGAVIVVDAVEGVMLNTERMIIHALESQLSICLVINKMDRLILELKLPPQDAYYKLMHTLEEVNTIIASNTLEGNRPQRLSPALGNVCFASAQHGWSFTLDSFAELYCARHPTFRVNPNDLAKRLWGDWYFNPENCAFSKKKLAGSGGSSPRTFIQYVLEPLYKIYASAIGETPEDLKYTLKQINVHLDEKEINLDPRPLLKLVLSRYFGLPKGFMSMVQKHIPSPIEGAAVKIERDYTGYQTSHLAMAMKECKAEGPLMINVVKMYNNPEGNKFMSLGRIYSGTITKGQRVKVLGEAYTQDDDEDMAIVEVTGISASVGRFFLEMDSAVAGNWVLLEGVDAPIKKTATITDLSVEDVYIFKALKFNTRSTMKLAVEPFNPSELPKMVEALRRVNKSYPLVTTKVEESGEHVILGTGELYLDCIMHDLRHLYSDMEIKVADPVVSFCETVVESSSINCFSETPNKRNQFTMLAEPMESGLADDIEHHHVDLDWDKKTIGDFFKTKYDWDLLTARSVWAFGPDIDGPNMLLDNTIPSEVDRNVLNTVRESIVQGFKWSCREGPLCDEPIRNVKFKVLDASIATEPIHRGGGQVIPTARRTAYSSFLMATPRLMEPVFKVEIQAPADCVQAVYPVLARRRGHVVQDAPKPGTPFYTIKAFLPIMDSFGFETDLRSYTLGQAFCQQIFDHWAVVPGDPLDRNVILHPLEPSPPMALARDFMVKTRRRKGLSEDVSINKYFDEAMIVELAKHEAEMGAIF